MSVRIIIGRAGSGKTQRCFQQISAEMRVRPMGPAIFWLVPRQMTFAAERQLTCASGLGAFTRARVVSFEHFAKQVLSECGGIAIPQVTAYGRQMILGLLLRRHEKELEFFKSVARHSGLAAKLDATFAELERCGTTPADLADPAEQPALGAKLRDLRLIYQRYCEYLGQERLDPHRRLEQVLGVIEQAKLLRGAMVLVDGFLDFTQYERQVLVAVAKACKDLEVALLGDPDSAVIKDPHRLPEEMGLFYRTEMAFRKLHFALVEQNIAIDEIVKLKGGSTGPPQDVELTEALDRRAEVEAAAAKIGELLAGPRPLRYRDIAVLMRDANDYIDLIETIFREHRIPFFLDRRRSVAHHPLLTFMRAVLQVARAGAGWPHDAMMLLCKSQLAGLSLDEADELENYVLGHRVRGEMWKSSEPWGLKRQITAHEEDEGRRQDEDATRADELRMKLAAKLRPFVQQVGGRSELAVREIVTALFAVFKEFSVQQSVRRWMEDAAQRNQLEEHEEHQQVWTELVELFDQMVELIGDEQVTLDQFIDILDGGLETFDLGLTPPTVDQVLVGDIERTRGLRPAVAIVLGMNEGQFPRRFQEDSIFSDVERRELRARQVEIESDSARKLLDENLLGYIALTRASEKLILMRSSFDEAGRMTAPSVFWRSVREESPELVVEESHPNAQSPATPRQLVTGLMRWVRNVGPAVPDTASTASGKAGPTWPALYQWLATSRPSGKAGPTAVQQMRDRAWSALSYANSSALSRETTAKLWGAPLVASVSELETFAACPFKHFLRYGLGLEIREEEDPTAIDLGNVYHQTLEKLVRALLKEQLDWQRLPQEKARQLIKTCTREVGAELRGELMMSSARNRHLLEHIEKTLQRVVASQTAAAQRGDFAVSWTELGFGPHDAALPALPALVVETPGGNQLQVRGKIDRVDLLEKEAAFAVIDYKMREQRMELDRVYHGLSLQLLTYLLVVQAHGEKLAGKPLTPAAAFYVKLLRQLESVKHPDEADGPGEQTFHLRHKPRGIVDAKFIKALDREIDTGASQVVSVYLNKDGRLGSQPWNDAAQSKQLWALLGHVEQKLGELADRILAGNVEIQPYWLGGQTPCPNCDYHSVCRFQVGHNKYCHVEKLSKQQVTELVKG